MRLEKTVDKIRMADEVYAIARRLRGVAAAADLAAEDEKGSRAADICRVASDVMYDDIKTLLAISDELERPENPPSQHDAERASDSSGEPETPVE